MTKPAGPTEEASTAATLDDLAVARASHEDLSELTEENVAQYTSLLVAYMRVLEAKRGADAIVVDSLAELLAGPAGKAAYAFIGTCFHPLDVVTAFIAVRTRHIDDTIRERDPSIRQVVILGAGLDSRAYRLESLAGCRVIEVDGSKSMMDRKQRLLREAGVVTKASHHSVVIADLEGDSWRAQLLETGFDPTQPTFWLMEGLMYYLSRDSNERLVKTLDALSAPGSQLWADVGNYTLDKSEGVDKRQDLFRSTTMRHGEDDPETGVLSLIQWKMNIGPSFNEPCEVYGRAWTPMMVESKTKPGEKELVPLFLVTATKPRQPEP